MFKKFLPCVLLGLVASTGCAVVDYDSYGVVLHYNKVTGTVLEAGWHPINPLWTKVVTVSSQVQTCTLSDLESSTSDSQPVKTTVVLNYFIEKDKASYVYEKLNYATYQDSVIKPQVNEKLKNVVSHYTAVELVTSRDKVSKELREQVVALLEPMGLTLQGEEGCSITNFIFSQAFQDSIEKKVIAEQDALREKNKLDQVKAEAEQTIEKARGESEAAKTIAEAITVPYVAYKAIDKWDGTLPTHFFGGTDNIQKVLPVDGFETRPISPLPNIEPGDKQ